MDMEDLLNGMVDSSGSIRVFKVKERVVLVIQIQVTVLS